MSKRLLRTLIIIALFLLSNLNSAAGSEQPDLNRIKINADLVAADVDRIEARLIIEPRDSMLDGSDEHEMQMTIEVPGTVAVKPKTPGPWSLRLISDGYWAEGRTISTPDAEATFRVFATAQVYFEIATSGDAQIPQIAEVDFSPAPRYTRPTGREVPKGKVICPLRDRKAACALPKGEVDLRIQTAGAAPLYFWDIDLRSSQEYDLGKLRIAPGGSIAGFVTDEEERGIKGAAIELAIAAPSTKNVAIRQRLEQMSREATTNERGFFQVSGIGPGTYSVEASLEGFSSAASARPITVRDDLEKKLSGPLILKAAPTLELVLEPPLDPLGDPWKVALFVPSDPSRGQVSGSVSVSGSWSPSGIEEGSYLMIISASDGSRWLGTEIEIGHGENLFFYELPVLHVTGTVSRGGLPVTGNLTLVLREKGSQIEYVLDDDGTFSGYLPDKGIWDVQVADAKQRGVLLALEPIEIMPRPGKSVVELEIEIPDTSIEGDVVDQDGNPVPGASIYLMDSELALHNETEADELGSFELSGLRPGQISVYALEGERSSDFQTVRVQDKMIGPRLRLVLQEIIEINGQVLSPERFPLPGASLLAWSDQQGVPIKRIHQATTDIDGSFVFRISKSEEVKLFVQAPGYASRILHSTIEPRGSIIIPLSRDGGTIVFDFSAETPRNDENPGVGILAQDGVFASLFTLLRASNPQQFKGEFSGILELRDMASGNYIFCFALEAELLQQGLPPATACDSAFLAPNGVVNFKTPAAARAGAQAEAEAEKP